MQTSSPYVAFSALLTLTAALSAQSETSPKGFLAKEGNTAVQSQLGYYSTSYGLGMSYLHIDATNTGQPRIVKALSLRRDGDLATNATYLARTVKLSIRMSHAYYGQVKGNTKQDESEYLASPWTTVFTEKPVSLPSLAQKPAGAPAPFSIVLQQDVQFPYGGNDALAFQILCSPNTDLAVNYTSYPLDMDITSPAIAPQTWLGTGCVATGESQPVSHYSYLINYGPRSRTSWSLTLRRAPVNAPAVTVLGLSNPSLSIGACESLLVLPDIALNGTTDESGELEHDIEFPHKAEFIGAAIYSQAAVYDAGKAPVPLALSQGMRIVYPADPIQPAVARAGELVGWASPAWPKQHVLERGAAMIFGLHD